MIKERITQVLEYKNIPKESFYVKIGMTSASFRGSARKTPLNSTAIENILSEIPDINPGWLITGEGDMLIHEVNSTNDPPVAYRSKVGIPLIPIDAMAGFGRGDMCVCDYECERYLVPLFREAEFLIQVKGDSMVPKYASGDVVACKKLILDDLFFQPNKVYVLDTAQGALIKRVKRSSIDEHVLIVSENPDYEPFDLAIRFIRSVAIVIGVIRLE